MDWLLPAAVPSGVLSVEASSPAPVALSAVSLSATVPKRGVVGELFGQERVVLFPTALLWIVLVVLFLLELEEVVVEHLSVPAGDTPPIL